MTKTNSVDSSIGEYTKREQIEMWVTGTPISRRRANVSTEAVLLPQSSCTLNLKRGCPHVQHELYSSELTAIPPDLMDCKYGKIVDQHYLVDSLATGMCIALGMTLDLASDTYYGLSLYHDEIYKDVSPTLKMVFALCVAIGNFLWVFLSCRQALKFRQHYLHDSLVGFPRLLHMCWLCMCYLFNMPTFLLVMGKRMVKMAAVQDGDYPNFVFVLAYPSKNAWIAMAEFGMIGHIPSLFIEDIPSLLINLYVTTLIRNFNFASIASFCTSLVCVIVKGIEVFHWIEHRIHHEIAFMDNEDTDEEEEQDLEKGEEKEIKQPTNQETAATTSNSAASSTRNTQESPDLPPDLSPYLKTRLYV